MKSPIAHPKKEQQSSFGSQSFKFPIVPPQIHRTSESIRKAIKIGKHRRMSKAQNIELFSQPNESNKIQQEKMCLRMQVNVKQIATNFNPKEIRSKLVEEQPDPVIDIITQAVKISAPKRVTSGDHMLYARKKLSPLRKRLIVQSKERASSGNDKKPIKISFFNVEKLNLIKMYSQLSSPEKKSSYNFITDDEGEMQRQRQRYSKFNRTAFMHQSSGSSHLRQDLIKNGDFYTCKQMPSPTRSNDSDPAKARLNLKVFVPPFESYFYKDFLWKVALSNGIQFESPSEYQQKLKIYIGKGNNSMLIRSLFKRRCLWWEITDRYAEANFVWTQIKAADLYSTQANTKILEIGRIGTDTASKGIQPRNKLGISYKLHSAILQDSDIAKWNDYYSMHRKVQQKLDECMSKRNKIFKFDSMMSKVSPQSTKIHNHLSNNYVLGNKKALAYTMSKYYEATGENVFDYLPLTFHIQNGLEDAEYFKFLNSFYHKAKEIRILQKQKGKGCEMSILRNVWIVKPGQFTNRGNGITVCFNLEDIKRILKQRERHDNGNLKTYIVQCYLDKPLLYCRRKFDLRHFIMITSINGRLKGYWYQTGYVRTTSYEYTLNQGSTAIHLTNDAVQKNMPDYGKFQKGNKITYQDLHRYLEKQFKGKCDFFNTVYPRIKKIATDAIRASSLSIDPQRKQHNFEIFGMDFMIDSEFCPWLIEVNTNPCYEVSCPLISDIIPEMLENAIKISVDSVLPPPASCNQKRAKFSGKILENNKFQLVYDSSLEEKSIRNLFQGFGVDSEANLSELQKEDDQIFDDDGFELDD